MTSIPTTPIDAESLAKAEFAFPGPLRDKLVTAILNRSKTATTGLLAAYEHEGEPLPETGARLAVVDSDDRPVAVIEMTSVRIALLADVDAAHAADEGEGHTTIAEWRAAHEEFWHSQAMRSVFGDATFTVDDTTPVVLERFHVIADLPLIHS